MKWIRLEIEKGFFFFFFFSFIFFFRSGSKKIKPAFWKSRAWSSRPWQLQRRWLTTEQILSKKLTVGKCHPTIPSPAFFFLTRLTGRQEKEETKTQACQLPQLTLHTSLVIGVCIYYIVFALLKLACESILCFVCFKKHNSFINYKTIGMRWRGKASRREQPVFIMHVPV